MNRARDHWLETAYIPRRSRKNLHRIKLKSSRWHSSEDNPSFPRRRRRGRVVGLRYSGLHDLNLHRPTPRPGDLMLLTIFRTGRLGEQLEHAIRKFPNRDRLPILVSNLFAPVADGFTPTFDRPPVYFFADQIAKRLLCVLEARRILRIGLDPFVVRAAMHTRDGCRSSNSSGTCEGLQKRPLILPPARQVCPLCALLLLFIRPRTFPPPSLATNFCARSPTRSHAHSIGVGIGRFRFEYSRRRAPILARRMP